MSESGEATTVLPDGTELAVSGATEPGWQLVIDPITDKEAVNWISGILDGKAKNLSPLHIYFIDGSGNVKAAESVTVTVKLPLKLTDPVAYSVTNKGKTFGLPVTVMNGMITFTSDGSSFYILGEKIAGEVTTPSDPGDSPQTGDGAALLLCAMLMVISIAGLTAALCCGRKKE